MILQALALASLLGISFFTQAQGVAEVSARRAAGDMATEFRNHRYPPSATPSPLPRREPQGREVDIVRTAQYLVDNYPVLSMVLVERGEIIFEAYNKPAAVNRPNFSWSMSKSLTAYTLGLMHCDGKFPDLDKPAQTYAIDLLGTVYGEASVRQLLMMSSGVRKAVSSGDHLVLKGNCEQGRDCDGWQRMRSQTLSGREYLHAVKDRDIESGKEFRYSGTDTLALGRLIETNGGVIKEFDRYLWSKIGAESAGYWLLDKDGIPIVQAGFSAVSRDWARLARYTIQLSKSGTECQQQFMRDATRPLIKNNGPVGAAHRGYGYQTWITTDTAHPSYWWVGYGGQRVAVDPDKDRVLVVTSHKESYMNRVRDLFTDWQRN